MPKIACFWTYAHDQKLVFGPNWAHMIVWVRWNMFYRVPRHWKPLFTYPTCLYFKECSKMRKITCFCPWECSKTIFWPNFGTPDGLSALKHALSCFSSSKTPIYIPCMHIWAQNTIFVFSLKFSHGPKWAWPKTILPPPLELQTFVWCFRMI